MTRPDDSWERRLEERIAALVDDDEQVVGVSVDATEEEVERAYRRVAEMTRREHPVVHAASLLLPRGQRRALQAMAGFLWKGDLLAERDGIDAPGRWDAWYDAVLAPSVRSDDDVLLAFAHARVRHGIPRAWVALQLEGQANDRRAPRHQTMDDLVGDCFHVLAPAALMMLCVLGVDRRDARGHAQRFAVAVQLTDYICDIDDDMAAGRLYMPRGELAAFGADPRGVREHEVDPAWRAFLSAMIERNRALYRQSEAGIALLPLAGGLATLVMGELYQAQLRDIEAHDYDVFRHPPRARLGHAVAAARAVVGHLVDHRRARFGVAKNRTCLEREPSRARTRWTSSSNAQRRSVRS